MKQNGLGNKLIIGIYDISNDVGQVSEISNPSGVQDSTGIDKYAVEKMKTKASPKLSLQGFFNNVGAHSNLSLLPNADVIVSYLAGSALGDVSASLGAKQINYDYDYSDSGELGFSVDIEGSQGLGMAWGRQLTNGTETVTSVGALPGFDFGGSANGGTFCVHVLSLIGTDITIELESSTDNTTWLSTGYSTVTTNPEVNLISIPKSATVNQYVRAVLSGAFTSADIFVSYSKGS